MGSANDTLRAIALALEEATPTSNFGDPGQMEQTTQSIRALLAAPTLPEVDHRQTTRAIERLIDDVPLSPGDVRRCCAAATTPTRVANRPVVLADEEALQTRLSARAREGTPRQQARYAACLAFAWFASPTGRPDEGALWQTLPELAAAGELTSPVTRAIVELETLFRDGNLGSLPEFVIGPSQAAVEPLHTLTIPAESWIWPEIIRTGLTRASAETDAQFRGKLGARVELLRGEPAVTARGVGMLLSRVASGRDRREHIALRDAALDSLGNPLLDESYSAWTRWTTDSARAMVATWLRRRAIRDFFEHLVGDRGDRRRADFWSGYAEVTDDLWFYVSSDTRSLQSNRVAELRRLLGPDRVRSVRHAGTNVFALRLGREVCVEFSATGNALFRYSETRPPRGFSANEPDLEDFKSPELAIERHTHQGAWEPRVEEAVYRGTGKRRS